MLREGDTNGDGLVSKEEFAHLLQVPSLAAARMALNALACCSSSQVQVR